MCVVCCWLLAVLAKSRLLSPSAHDSFCSTFVRLCVCMERDAAAAVESASTAHGLSSRFSAVVVVVVVVVAAAVVVVVEDRKLMRICLRLPSFP